MKPLYTTNITKRLLDRNLCKLNSRHRKIKDYIINRKKIESCNYSVSGCCLLRENGTGEIPCSSKLNLWRVSDGDTFGVLVRECVVFRQTSFFQLHQNSNAPCAMFYYADIPIKTTSNHYTMPPISGFTSWIQSFTICLHSNSRQAFVCSQNVNVVNIKQVLKSACILVSTRRSVLVCSLKQ